MRVALVQTRTPASQAAALDHVLPLVRQAADLGAELILTPEGTNILQKDRDRLRASLTPVEADPVVCGLRDLARERGVLVGALTGAREHALKHAQAGVDALIAAGGEAGGHCGDVATLVLVPEVLEAVRDYPEMFVLAAGGVVTGRQMAACMAMGADGAWCGSVWLTTREAETNPVVKEKMLAATSRETVRSRSRTGKYTRQLRSAWTDAWQSPQAPDPLAMPLQSLVSEPALALIDKLAQGGDPGARALATYWVGQGVGLMNRPLSVRQVVQEFMEDFADASQRLASFTQPD